MMWGQQPFGGYPFYGPPPNYQYIPVPQSDAERVLKIMKHLDKKKERHEKREEEAAKKKKESSAPKPVTFTFAQTLVLVTYAGLPLGVCNYWLLMSLAEALKHLVK